jgi:hypothetical protein
MKRTAVVIISQVQVETLGKEEAFLVRKSSDAATQRVVGKQRIAQVMGGILEPTQRTVKVEVILEEIRCQVT